MNSCAGSLLGIDLGISVIKATLFTPENGEITVARSSGASHPYAGWVEKDAQEIWQTTVEVIREVLAAQPPHSPPVTAVGVCACGNGLVALDRSGQPVRPAIFSNDRRAADIVEQWRGGWMEKNFPITRQSPYPGQTAPLLAWIRDYEPENWRRIAHVLLHKDYLRYRLTGAFATDPTDFSATNLLPLLGEGGNLLASLGLDEIAHALPRLVPSAAVAGEISAEAAAATGLPKGTPVATGTIDCEAALLGSGIQAPATLSIVAGSWAINQALVMTPPSAPVAQTIRSARSEYFTAIEASPTSAINFEWLVNGLFATEAANLRAGGCDPFEHFAQLAEKVPASADRPFFLPYLHGSPRAVGASGGFIGLRPETGSAELARSVLESVAFSHRWHVDRLRAAGLVFHESRLTGGAARSPFWRQLFADTLNLPIEVPEGREIGARGAALCAGVAAGYWNSLADAQRENCPAANRTEPSLAGAQALDERYARFQQLLEALTPFWQTSVPDPLPTNL